LKEDLGGLLDNIIFCYRRNDIKVNNRKVCTFKATINSYININNQILSKKNPALMLDFCRNRN